MEKYVNGKTLRDARVLAELTQFQLKSISGVQAPMISRLENRKRIPIYDLNLLKLVKALKLDINKIVEDERGNRVLVEDDVLKNIDNPKLMDMYIEKNEIEKEIMELELEIRTKQNRLYDNKTKLMDIKKSIEVFQDKKGGDSIWKK